MKYAIMVKALKEKECRKEAERIEKLLNCSYMPPNIHTHTHTHSGHSTINYTSYIPKHSQV